MTVRTSGAALLAALPVIAAIAAGPAGTAAATTATTAAPATRQGPVRAAPAGVTTAAIGSCYGSGSRWWCSNASHAPVYCEPDDQSYQQCGWLDSTTSWFQCKTQTDVWGEGPYWGGATPVWLYTQGDETYPGHEGRHAWGWVNQSWISSSTDRVRWCG
ncbi:hypothetical protein [Actinomadura gamaensis]|uniref:Secreted protein n=1 Tax=Actinomadura gamaensis TaxID=1763541 RepID=A0ABV9TRG3_9ACTN